MAQLEQPHPQPPLPDSLSFMTERSASARITVTIAITTIFPKFSLSHAAIIVPPQTLLTASFAVSLVDSL